MSWRDELDVVLQEWIAASGGERGGQRWRRVGAAQRGSKAGQYVVDTRASNLSADQVDELRLAGPDAESIPKGVPVMEAVFDGELLRLRVAEFANPAQPHLWRLQQEPGFLIKKLREGLAQLPDAGLANLLAQGETGGKLANVRPPAWLKNGQEKAYLACRGEGLWLVWGPPGTGKTRVLRSAIGDLLKDGKRVLLVSGTNVAVDNALNEVLKERHFERGEMVRVGPPHLHEIADNPDISLPQMVRDSLAQLEEKRHAAAEALLEMNGRQEQLKSLEEQVADFDPVTYDRAASLLAARGSSVAELGDALAQSQEEAATTTEALEAARAEHAAAQAAVSNAGPFRPLWAEVSRLEAELVTRQEDVTQAKDQVLQAKALLDAAEADVLALQQPDGKVRWRDRRAHRDAAEVLDSRRTEYEDLRTSAAKSRQVAEAARRANEPRIARLEASAPFGRDEIQRRDGAAALAEKRVDTLERAQRTLTDRQAQLTVALEAARKADALYTSCNRRDLPGLYSSAGRLRQQTKRDSAQRARLEKHHDDLQAQYERMSKNAQGEIIKAARLVATTLARFRIVKAVLDGPYDVVLIDEVGAATLPEVLLAVAKAGTCAVLLGDFMQLSPVFPPALKQSDRSDIRKWLITDPFRHCGISTLDEARNHRSCLVLDTQHRFGPDVMRLANLLAYDGLLKPGPGMRRHAEGDSEIVLIDTDGLGDLEQVQRPRPGAKSGWWPAGLLLSRMIVDMHREDGETTGVTTGVVTPYRAQFEATLEALRDVEPGGNPVADVGTAHRFQGREFPVVVFDTVESQYGKPMWIGEASRMPGSNSWRQEGVRLFNVAATRVQHRLYVIASGQRLQAAPRGTALAHLNTLVYDRQVTLVRAASLITPSDWEPVDIRPESTALAEVLARHIEVTDIDDERTFYPRLTDLIAKAQQSIWIWSGWVATRVHRLLPLLEEAAGRGVKITVFTRDPSDRSQGDEISAEAVSALRDVVDRVIEVNVAHQKVIVVDDHTVMMGSLNALSQRWTREVMITMRGQYFARRLLHDLHAEELSTPPACGACQEKQVDLRRRRDDSYYWRCYNKSCPAKGKSRYGAWTEPVVLTP